MTETNMVPALRAPSGSCGPHRPLHIPTVTSAHSHPTFTLGLLQMYTRTHEYKHTSTESQRTWWVHAHTCTHKEVRSIQSPRVVPGSAHGSLSVAPTCPHAKPRPQGRASRSRGPMVCSDVGQQAEGVHTRVHARDVPGPGLCWALILHLPEQLFRALSPLPCLHPASPTPPPPVLSEPPHLDGMLSTGALAGSVPTPTQALTDTGQGRVRGGVVGEGTTNQSSSCLVRGVLRTAGSGRKRLFPGGLRQGREGQQRVQSPPARGLVEPKLWAAGQRCLVRRHGPGMHMAAHTGLCMAGDTAQDTDTHSSRQQCRRRGQGGRVGGWGHLSKATRKLPGSNENMSFRLKAAGEQELKICNRNGGLSGGGWGGGRPGVQS